MRPKLYLAGPEVFLPDAIEYAAAQRALCERYGFEALHPLDNSLDLGNQDLETAMRIWRGDVQQIRDCDAVVANCNGFRGVCMDDGTAYELGFANALGKPSYGYIAEVMSQVARTIRDYPTAPHESGLHADREGYLVTDDFGTSINLMMECGMLDGGGRLVEGGFEDCLRAVREDLDAGRLKL
jgi:nucleoside 2-deoxyribosyltransferase